MKINEKQINENNKRVWGKAFLKALSY